MRGRRRRYRRTAPVETCTCADVSSARMTRPATATSLGPTRLRRLDFSRDLARPQRVGSRWGRLPFPNRVQKPVSLALTQQSRGALETLDRRHRISRSNVVEAPLRQCGEQGVLTIPAAAPVDGLVPCAWQECGQLFNRTPAGRSITAADADSPRGRPTTRDLLPKARAAAQSPERGEVRQHEARQTRERFKI